MSNRVVEIERHVGLSDVRPDGRMRLDAIARVVQDVADRDAATAEIEGMGVWILRRLALDIAHTPRFRADLTLRTSCTGTGARWAERTTSINYEGRSCIEATALWVHTDPASGAPIPLPKDFDRVWDGGERRVSARLQHARPAADGRVVPWSLRATDLDVVGHVNNAAYWAPVEDELARRARPRIERAEIEFRAGLDPDDEVQFTVSDRADGFASWLLVDGDVRASMLIKCRA
jgi:acyl-ACP thioesterase